MSYFLRKFKKPKGTYLQIVEGHRDPVTHEVVQSVYKTLGYAENLHNDGLADPIQYYTEVVNDLNAKLQLERENTKKQKKQIGSVSPERYMGYFPIKKILDGLGVKPYINVFNKVRDFKYDIYEVLSALVFARIVAPCSKRATFHDVLPNLINSPDISYDQILSCCEFMGSNYEKIIEIFTAMVEKKYGLDTERTYFDCTNFFFEIDREDELRRIGPSKENRKSPIVGMGLLLDTNMIPIGMRMYPGNESEKPLLRKVIEGLKRKNQIKGKTIHVADKGLNTAENIYAAKKDSDGYIFSKSVKMLSEVEKVWVKLDNDWIDVFDENNELKYRYKECIDSFPYEIKDENGKKVTIHLKEKRVLTFNPKLAEKQKAEINKMVEKARGLCFSRARRSEFGETGKFITFKSKNNDDDSVIATVNEKAVKNALSLCGYNMLVTSELNMSSTDIYGIYHNLWRIEESFRVMKTELEARPVFLQKSDSIFGHFLICYIAALLIRLLQFKVLDNKYGTSEIIKFLKEFKGFYVDDKTLVNASSKSKMIDLFSMVYFLNLNDYFLTKSHLKTMGFL